MTIRIAIALLLCIRPSAEIHAYFIAVFRVYENVLMIRADDLVIRRRTSLLPNYLNDKVVAPENLIQRHADVMIFSVVNGNKENAIFSKQFPKHLKAWPHHAQPLIVTL